MRAILAAFIIGSSTLGAAAALAPQAVAADMQATTLSDADRQEVRRVISEQLDAFKKDDGSAAFGFASPGIQGMFGNADIFMKMVKNSYPQVYGAKETEFRDLVDLNGRPTQRVLIVGPDGKPVMALYAMERQPDGSWKIAGCMLAKADEVTA